MADREISTTQRRWLVAQLNSWQSRQIVSPEQVSRILGLYETPDQLSQRSHSLLLTTLMGVAAVMIGLAALLLIGYNWQAMPAAVKLAIIFGVLLATQGAGFFFRYRRDSPLLSEVCFFLGSLFYGAAIFLIAQIFHVNANATSLVWWWAIGVLPFAMCLATPLLHVLLVALLAIWCGMEAFGGTDIEAWLFRGPSFLPRGAYTLPVFASAGLVWAYRRGSLAVVWLYVPLLAWWAILQPVAWRFDELMPFTLGTVACALMLIAEIHPAESRFAEPYRQVGMLLMAGLLLVMSYFEASREFFGDHLQRFSGAHLGLGRTAFGGMFALFAMLMLAILLHLISFHRGEPELRSAPLSIRVWQTCRRQWLPVALTLLMILFMFWWALYGGPLLPTILANVAMLALAFWLINSGLSDDVGRTFAAGVIYLLLWAVLRYIDLFGNFGGMLGAALMFLLCGIALFAVAWFWRHRKEAQHV